MAPTKIGDRLYTWADDVDPKTIHQAAETANKDIEDVMARQTDLVRVRTRLVSILNYKGT